MNHPDRMTEFRGFLITHQLKKRLIELEPIINELNDVKRMNLPDICAYLKIGELAMNRHLKMLNIRLHNKKAWSLADKTDWPKVIIPMIKKGMHYVDIAKEVKSSKSVVYNWCVRNGCDRKTLLDDWYGKRKTSKN